MAEAERRSAPEVTPAPTPSAPGGGVAALVTPSYGDVTSLVGALAAGPDDWRADVIHSMQRTSGNRAVLRLLEDAPQAPVAVAGGATATAAKRKKTGIAADKATGHMASTAKDVYDDWGKLKSADARARKIASAALSELKKAGVPAYRIVVKNLGGNLGQF